MPEREREPSVPHVKPNNKATIRVAWDQARQGLQQFGHRPPPSEKELKARMRRLKLPTK